MSLQYGLLGLLMYQDSTGYELTKAFEASLNNFWHAQSSQIYRELSRMEEKGWLTSQSVIQEKRPNKRVYAITDKGRNEVQKWLDTGKVEFDNAHEPLLVRVFFGANAPEVTLALLKACRKMCLAHIENLQKRATSSISHYSTKFYDGANHSLYWEMTLDYGIANSRTTVEWAERCIEKLEGEAKA